MSEVIIPEVNREIDAIGMNCPLPILRTKKALAEMESGQILMVKATDAGAVHDFPVFAKQTEMNSLLPPLKAIHLFFISSADKLLGQGSAF